MEICPHLKKILDFELNRGNEIQDQGKLWTKMEFSIYLEKSIDKQGIENIFQLENCVHYSKSEDPHYLMHGFYCDTCKQNIDSPLDKD